MSGRRGPLGGAPGPDSPLRGGAGGSTTRRGRPAFFWKGSAVGPVCGPREKYCLKGFK